MYRREGLQPLARAAKVSSAMVKQDLNKRILATQNIALKQTTGHKGLNPYENIMVGVPRKLMPQTVMNSREKLKTVAQHQPPTTAQDVRNSENRELLIELQKSAAKSGGMSQMATTAPRNEDDYGYAASNGGRITAEL